MKKLPLILLTHTLPADWVAVLEGKVQSMAGPVDATELAPQLVDHLSEAEGLICLLTIPVNKMLLDQMPKLRVVSCMSVGVDNVDVAECTRRGIPVGNTPGILTDATADLTMAILLAAARRLPEAAGDAKQGRWQTWSPTGWLGVDLRGAVLGIVGMGKIGTAVAERARGFGMKVIYTDPKEKPETKAEFHPLESLLRQSDFITLHCPLTEETRGLMNDRTLGMMKKNAILINVSRGQVVDTVALVHALENHQIAAAALDVSDPEPLPPDHPLYKLPNCLIVPHIGSATFGTRQKMAKIACENLLVGLSGEKLRFCINPEVYQ